MRSVGAALLLVGCTVANPNYGSGGVGSGGNGANPGGGNPAANDLGTATPADSSTSAADLAPVPTACSDGQRSCATSGPAASQACVQGSFANDRTCPSGATTLTAPGACTSGFCQPPAGAPACNQPAPNDDACFSVLGSFGFACQPFVDGNGGTRWYCAATVGMGVAGMNCSSGSDCRSGICGQNGTCFRACDPNHGCQSVGSGNLNCNSVTFVVEGQTVTADGCVP